MSEQTIRMLVAGVLFIHGISHTVGFWMPVRSWLLPGLTKTAARWISSVFWILSVVGFIGAALGYLGVFLPFDLRRWFAVGSAVVSLSGLFLFGNNWALLNSGGATITNLVVLISLLWLRWPPGNTI